MIETIVLWILSYLIGMLIFVVLLKESRWDRYDGHTWNWHKGCRCENCGKLYSRITLTPEHCKNCGSNKGYKPVVVRMRWFKLEELNEEKKKL